MTGMITINGWQFQGLRDKVEVYRHLTTNWTAVQVIAGPSSVKTAMGYSVFDERRKFIGLAKTLTDVVTL